jgi:protein TonB
MPGIMFQDVVSLRARSNRRWYTLPLSFLVHTSVLAVILVIPVIATDVLPKPRSIMQFVTPYVPVIPAVPPPTRRASPPPAAAPTGRAPVVAPDSIGVESGVIVQPGTVETAGIDGLVGGLDVGTFVIDAPPPAAVAPVTPLVIGGNIKPPARIKYVAPDYPPIALSVKAQGVVIVEAVIGADGKVQQARVLRGKPLLDEAALAAVRSWEYTPTLLNGQPTPVIMTVTVQFTLK